MIQNTGPYDLNIPINCGDSCTPTTLVKRALALGYRTIALNVSVSQSQFLTKKQAKTKTDDKTLADFPPPPSVQLQSEDYPELAAKGLSPTILTRLTISITNNDFLLHYNKSVTAKQYDLLAINITSSQCLLSLLKSGFRWDILSFSPAFEDTKETIKWTRKLYYECVDKNVYFELPYSPLIRGSFERRRVISQSHVYHSVGKSRNIIVTSGAMTAWEMRAPTDVSNLAFILGMSENQGKDSVSNKCWLLHKAATGRRMGPFQVRIEKVTEEQEESSSDEESESESDSSEEQMET